MKNSKLLVVLGLIIFLGCKEEKPEPTQNQPTEKNEMSFTMASNFKEEPLAFNSTSYTLPSGESLEVVRFSFLMSHFFLIDAEGDTIFLEDHYALIDPKRGKDTFSLRNIPNGSYTHLGFEVGLEDEINFGNPNDWSADHVMNPLNNGLYWDWNGGYIFMAIEGFTEVDGKSQAVVYHIAGDLLRKKLVIPFSKIADHNGKETSIECSVDFNALFDEPHIFSMKDRGYFSHSGDSTLFSLVQNYERIFTF